MSDFLVHEYRKERSGLPSISANIYVKDPLVASERPNLGLREVAIKGEACIGPGPTTSRIAVVDYNADLDTLFRGAELKRDETAFKLRLPKHRLDDFHFHQINVWAVAHLTLELLEGPDVFGRSIPWAFPGGRLVILPHAGYWENAFYDRSSGSLQFFYFENAATGKPVYTCLSHDIVSHELGHAVLDGLKPYYNEVTSAQTAGFHEYFGDSIALTMALSHRPVLQEVVRMGNGDLSSADVIHNIAAEFGQGLNAEYGSLADAYLRNANNEDRMSDIEGEMEEHKISSVPTGAYYELLQLIYEKMMEKKDRTKGNHRYAALYSAAKVTRGMMLRALDYCPPVDLQYEDYAAAVICADMATYPVDSSGFRQLAREVFERRELGAKLPRPDEDLPIRNDQLRDLDIEQIAASHTDAYHFLDRNRSMFLIPAEANFNVINLYRTQKTGAYDYRVPPEIVIEFVWKEELELTERRFGPLRGSFFPLWCGGTAVFSREGNLLHYTVKRNVQERRKQLGDYVAFLVGQGYLTVDDGEQGIGASSSRGSKVVATLRHGRVESSRCAAMRHVHRPSEEHAHG